MKPCPGIKGLGTVWGGWNPATAKTEVLKVLASHPQKIDLVMQQGLMQAVIIEAFEQAGRPVPPMAWNGSSGGDLSWWADHKDTYHSVGGQYGGAQVAYTTFNILMRTLAGRGPKLRDMNLPRRSQRRGVRPLVRRAPG